MALAKPSLRGLPQMKVLAGAQSAAARDAEINGAAPKIGPIPENELSHDALEYCRNLRIALGIPENGEIPEVTATMLRHPALNEAQTNMGIMLAANGTISPRERELAILRQAWVTGSPYEWGEHVDIGKRFGLTGEDIERIIQGSEAPGWSAHEAAILRAVDEMLDRYRISDETWAVLAQTWGEQQLLELPILVGAYVATAMQQNSMGAALRANNPGLTHR
jgi:4-carboxymuconolactone decarboxylase